MSDGDRGKDGMQHALSVVWNALERGEGIGQALAACNGRHPWLAATFFRAAVRWKLASPYDIRVVTRFIAGVHASDALEYRSLPAPREAEAFIRADLGGEVGLTSDIALDAGEPLIAMQVITRVVFEEAAGSGGLSSLGREIVRTAADYRNIADGPRARLYAMFLGRELALGEFERMAAAVDHAIRLMPELVADVDS
jgi:hypothetical protein